VCGEAGEFEQRVEGLIAELELLGRNTACLRERVARLCKPLIHVYVM